METSLQDTHTRTHTHMDTQTHTRTSTHAHTHAQAHTWTHTDTHMHVHRHTCMYTDTQTHTCMHTHTLTRMHTRMHTCTLTSLGAPSSGTCRERRGWVLKGAHQAPRHINLEEGDFTETGALSLKVVLSAPAETPESQGEYAAIWTMGAGEAAARTKWAEPQCPGQMAEGIKGPQQRGRSGRLGRGRGRRLLLSRLAWRCCHVAGA